eukprot:scaffold84970_cov69-Phaeocystis_antarctica.AAC.3
MSRCAVQVGTGPIAGARCAAPPPCDPCSQSPPFMRSTSPGAWVAKGGETDRGWQAPECRRNLSSAAKRRALLSGPEGGPERAGGLLERGVATGCCEPEHLDRAGAPAAPLVARRPHRRCRRPRAPRRPCAPRRKE